jgi:hypothetical protein
MHRGGVSKSGTPLLRNEKPYDIIGKSIGGNEVIL